jgi:enoyl-CoA hydratase
MAFDNLLLERDGAVAIVTINRPKVLNALNSQTIDELRRAILELKADHDVRVVVLTGAGEKSFVAGADINELAVRTPVSGREHALAGQHVFDLVENMGKPVIAAINGFALGGGCELAMACTLRLAADTAKLGQPEISLGLIPGYAGTQRLPRLVGKGKAMELVLTGAPIGADEAQRIGLVNRVVPAAGLLKEARALAAQLATSAPIAMRYIINAINKGVEMPFAEACQYEATLFGLVASTEDMREGTRAFLEKRKADFKGR